MRSGHIGGSCCMLLSVSIVAVTIAAPKGGLLFRSQSAPYDKMEMLALWIMTYGFRVVVSWELAHVGRVLVLWVPGRAL